MMGTRHSAGVGVSMVLLFSTLALLPIAGVHPVLAVDPPYPTRQVELVVTAAPGGAADIVARATAGYLSKKWNQSIVVVNKPGGGTVIGGHYALKQAKPDGYTVLGEGHPSSSMLVAGMVNPPIKLEDRIFVARIVLDPIGYAVKADSPFKTFKELGVWVKANAQTFSYATIGPAGLTTFAVNEWLVAIGVNPADVRMVTTDGSSDSLAKLAGGHVTLAAQTVGDCFTLAQAGKVRILAVLAEKRSPFVSDVPTTTEAGVPGLTVKWWNGVSMPVGTPAYIVDKWAKELANMCKDPVFLQQTEKLHLGISYLGPSEFKDFVYKEAEYYTKLASKIGIRK
jgi:tripartite-type tricarboxylate transporter receptor subunit TctC